MVTGWATMGRGTLLRLGVCDICFVVLILVKQYLVTAKYCLRANNAGSLHNDYIPNLALDVSASARDDPFRDA